MEIKKNINVNSEIINNEFGGEGLKQALTIVKSAKESEYYKTTREVTKQALRPTSIHGDLFNSNILGSEAKKYALQLKNEERLLSEIGDGLNCGHMGRLVVEAL